MTRPQLRRLFKKHYGAAASIAKDLELSRGTISRWLQGYVTSRRIEHAVRARAEELTRPEQSRAIEPQPLDLQLDY